MSEIRVRAEQTTVEWEAGAEFVVERTPLVDHMIDDGRLRIVDDLGEVDVIEEMSAPSEYSAPGLEAPDPDEASPVPDTEDTHDDAAGSAHEEPAKPRRRRKSTEEPDA